MFQVDDSEIRGNRHVGVDIQGGHSTLSMCGCYIHENGKGLTAGELSSIVSSKVLSTKCTDWVFMILGNGVDIHATSNDISGNYHDDECVSQPWKVNGALVVRDGGGDDLWWALIHDNGPLLRQLLDDHFKPEDIGSYSDMVIHTGLHATQSHYCF